MVIPGSKVPFMWPQFLWNEPDSGARFVGGEELLIKIKNGLIQKESDYDYLIAHMDIIQELGAQLKKKHSVRDIDQWIDRPID